MSQSKNLPNIVLIVIDALRADSLENAMTLGIAPTLKKIIDKGIMFVNAYSTINATDPSITTIFTGLHPLVHGIIHHGEDVTKPELAKAYQLITLPKLLRRQRYFTIAIDLLGRWHKLGFDLYVQRHHSLLHRLIRKVKGKIFYQYPPSHDISAFTRSALKYLDKYVKSSPRRNFFLFLHFWNTHIPYYAPPQFFNYVNSLLPLKVLGESIEISEVLSKLQDIWFRNYLVKWFKHIRASKVEDVVRWYYASIAYVDYQIHKLIKFLKALDTLENTVVIITSDHGESLGEHGIYFDHHGLYQVSLRVPLIIYWQGMNSSTIKIKGRITHVDLMPTITDFLHASVHGQEHEYLDNLIRNDKRPVERPIIAVETYCQRRMAILTSQWKLILAPSPKDLRCRYCVKRHGGLYELYNLIKDPNELNDLSQEHMDLIKELSRRFYKQILRFKLMLLKQQLITRRG